MMASMRPRVFPAEDGRCRAAGIRPTGGFNEAAGIPRGRHGAARVRLPRLPGFNEAAGIPRGRQRRVDPGREARGASMRPRVFPAEDSDAGAALDLALDASMRPRVFPAEDLRIDGRPRRRPDRFNEAAGIPRGRRKAVYVDELRMTSLQ